MKKGIALVLVTAMVAAMAACGKTADDSKAPETNNTETTAAESVQDTESAGAADTESKDSDKLIMVTEAGFAPYEYTEDGQTVVGVDVDIANEIAKALGKELEIQNTTFDGALLAVQQGKADFAAAGISITPAREEQMDFSIEYATSRQVVVVNKNAGRVDSVDALNDKTQIGVQSGTVADIYCTDDMGWKPKQYNKFMEAAMDLKNDKIDCIIMDALPAEEMVAANDDLAILDGEVLTDRYAIAVEKGNTELLEQINAVLEQLIADGKIEEFTINHTTK